MKQLIALLAVVSMFVRSSPVRAQMPPPTPGCSVPTREAEVTKSVAPELSRDEYEKVDGPVTVRVSVEVSPNGVPHDAKVVQSSGFRDIDASALWAASASKYAPKLVHCLPVSGIYVFRLDVKPGNAR